MASSVVYLVSLPVDIYSTICRHAATKDLTTLCRVSQTFRDETERILYYSVNVTHITEGERLMSWCNVIATSQQSHACSRSTPPRSIQYAPEFNGHFEPACPPGHCTGTESFHKFERSRPTLVFT